MQFLLGPPAIAQPPAESPRRLVDRTPFDQITLNSAAGGKTLEILPLDLPQRPLARVPTMGNVIVRLPDRPTQEFELSWSDVAQVRVFEQLLLDEARRLTASGRFDDAYDYFARLSAQNPSCPGLNEAISDFLRSNAMGLYQARDQDRALALLLALYERDPKSAGLAGAVEKVAGEIIQQYLNDGNYAAARSVLILWQTQFRDLAAAEAAEWQHRFEAAATKHANEAERLIQNKQYLAARKSIDKARAIWPQLDATTSLVARIQREFPFVTVGVFESAPRAPGRRIDCWPALRASRLTGRLLAEQIDFGAEGGVYRGPFGELAVDESGRQLSFKLNEAARAVGLTADELARHLLSLVDPKSPLYRADFASLLSRVALNPPDTVQINLAHIHVRPEAMLQVPPPEGRNAPSFTVAEASPDQLVFTATAATSAQPRLLQAVVEQTMPDDEAAVAALISGDIDVLDRVPPWHLARLRAEQGLRVETYCTPTIHVLIPNATHPLFAKREFRRALCYGIDRQWIVARVLLGGAKVAGFEAVSGPFPAGTSLSDPVRYAYNNQILPRPFEPRLAAILATIAWSNVQRPADAKENAAAAAPIPELTLAHPTDPVARLACQSIQTQLQRQGITLKLKEFGADELLAGRVDCDLRYAELAIWEPVADARLLLGPGSLTGDAQSPYLNAALRQLDESTNWNDVRFRLAEVHEIVHHDLPVIPLWQTINYFAYRTSSVRDIGASPVTLYQNIERWAPASPSNVARLDQDAR